MCISLFHGHFIIKQIKQKLLEVSTLKHIISVGIQSNGHTIFNDVELLCDKDRSAEYFFFSLETVLCSSMYFFQLIWMC